MASFFARRLRQGRAVAVGAVALCALSAPALAAEPCAPREEIVQHLASDFNEKPVGMGLSASGGLVVMFASPAGTWSAVTVSAQGAACVIDVGNAWTDMSEAPGVTAQSQ
jgi:hypothetical protein